MKPSLWFLLLILIPGAIAVLSKHKGLQIAMVTVQVIAATAAVAGLFG
jgi:hypothetical protein